MTSFRDEESRGDLQSLQSRVNIVVLDSAEGCRVDLSILMCQLLEAQETAAFVWIWDLAKARGVVISASVRVAMERLHQLGKGNVPDGTLILPKNSGARIKAARRLHKIVMGPVRGSKLAARSAAVTPDAELRAAAWLQTTEAKQILGTGISVTTKGGRQHLARAMMKALVGLSKPAALGLITKFKRKKML